MQLNRYIELEGASNFREIGALNTTNGFMKAGLLYRSDDLSTLSINDLQIIARLNLKTIIDLRTPNEIKYKPDKLPADNSIKIINIPFFHQKRDYNQLQIMWYLITNSRKTNFEKFIKEHYLNNAFERAIEIGKIFKVISEPENLPTLIHCKAGKDRTGLISAIIQLLAGAPRKTILEEYLATNFFMKNKMEKIEKIIRRMSLFRASSEKIKPLLEVRPEYLNDAIDKIFAQYGSIENYLAYACGVEKATFEKVKSLISTR